MTIIAQARVPTAHAQKYATQVGKQWAHNLAVEDSAESVKISFPKDARGANWPGDALVTLTPTEGMLLCEIGTSAEGQRDGLKQAVERHVDRFAFREGALRYDWTDFDA